MKMSQISKWITAVGAAIIIYLTTMAIINADSVFDSGNFKTACVEPTASEDGSALTDLDKITIYYSIDGGVLIKAKDVAATSPTGGGEVRETIAISGLGNQADIQFRYTATDLSGNESGQLVDNVIRIDSMPPSEPGGLTP